MKSAVVRSFSVCLVRRMSTVNYYSTLSVPEHSWSRDFYRYFVPIQTRWKDNDQYGHVNNVVYYSYFDTIINHYLIKNCYFNTCIKTSNIIGIMAETKAMYRRPVSFPQQILSGLCVTRLGTSSVTYQVGIFAEAPDQSTMTHLKHELKASVVGYCVHVFVDPKTQRPKPLPSQLKTCLEKIVCGQEIGVIEVIQIKET